MIRKFLCAVVLISMSLHCASRLEFLTYCYKNRHAIASSLGFAGETRITMCNSDYDFGRGLKIEGASADHTLPIFSGAHEINLFQVSRFTYSQPATSLFASDQKVMNSDKPYRELAVGVFHPPTILS